MSDQFVGEIRIVGFNFPPRGWAYCDGQLIPINQNPALFSLLGTTYGGDGRVTFALPDMQGRAPMQPGQGQGLTPRDLGETGGWESITLIEPEVPAHTHSVFASLGDPTSASPAGMAWSKVDQGNPPAYGPLATPVTMRGDALAPAGSNQPHNNMQPYLCLNFIIALEGVFPARP